MAVSFSNAINAYNAAAKAVTNPDAARQEQDVGGGSSFASMVKDSLREARDLGLEAEQMQMKAINGEADLRDVVLAVSNAELALDTVTTVRDRVMTAYQEILKMAI